MADLRSLANKMDKLYPKIQKQANGIVKRVASEVLTTLVMNTPVDTSQALSNWLTTIGDPAEVTREPYVAGMFGSTRSASASEAIATGKAVIAAKRPGEAIFIANRLDYIEALDEGRSSQNRDFVAKAINAGKAQLAKEKINV